MPRRALEAKSVLDHWEAATDEIGDSSVTATDVVARSRREVIQTSLNRHLLPDQLELASLKSRHGATRDTPIDPSGRVA